MMVFAGLYDPKVGLAKDEDELAAVIGHELAHVNCRHSTRRMSIVMPAMVFTELGVAALEANDRQGLAQALQATFVVVGTLALPGIRGRMKPSRHRRPDVHGPRPATIRAPPRASGSGR